MNSYWLRNKPSEPHEIRKREPENVKIRYTVKFEKTVPCVQQAHETREDMIERIADKLFYNNGEAIDGEIKDIDNIEEIE